MKHRHFSQPPRCLSGKCAHFIAKSRSRTDVSRALGSAGLPAVYLLLVSMAIACHSVLPPVSPAEITPAISASSQPTAGVQTQRPSDADALIDGRYRRIDAEGKTLPEHGSESWSCVLDQRTGLIWEIKLQTPGLQSTHNSYTWYQPDVTGQMATAGYQQGGHCTNSPCDTSAYIAAINAKHLCGLTHWRLPSRFELKSLIDYTIPYPGPVINQDFFPNTSPQFYWSLNPDVSDSDSAWGVGFSFGYDYAYFKSDFGRVRLVHDASIIKTHHINGKAVTGSGQQCQINFPATSSPNTFVDNQDGTLTDERSGLMWMRCAIGQVWQDSSCVGEAQLRPFKYFLQTLLHWQFAGHSDWRIPSVNELDSITELQCINPAINLSLFPGTEPHNFWSATAFANDSTKQWLVHFLYGENHVELKNASARIRLVRNTMSKPGIKPDNHPGSMR